MKIVIHSRLITSIMLNLSLPLETHTANAKKRLLSEKEVEAFLVIKWKTFFEERFHCRTSAEVTAGRAREGKNCNLSVIHLNASNI